MKKVLSTLAMAALGLGMLGAAHAYYRQPQLELLGRDLQLSAAQQPAWQQVLQSAAAARTATVQQANQRIDGALQLLNTPGSDLSPLSREPDPDSPAALARQQAREKMLSFYASATPAQQAQIRRFLTEKLTRIQKFMQRRADMLAEAS